MIQYYTYGNRNDKPLFMGSSLGTSSDMWNNIIDPLSQSHYIIAFDTRGHGASKELGLQPLSVEIFAKDVIEIADHLGIDKFDYVGLSLGGAIGQMLAINYPERVNRLILCCTAPKFGEKNFWLDRGNKVISEGMSSILEATKARWYTPGFAETDKFAQELLNEMLKLDPQAYANVCNAVGDFDVVSQLDMINVPTLLLAGTEDLSTPVSVMQDLANGIPNATLVAIPGAAHLANVEKPDNVAQAILNFL